MIFRVLKFAIILLVTFPTVLNAATVRYQLEVSQGSINLSNKKTVDWALMVNGSIPGPALEFQEGDDAEIEVVNRLSDQEVSMHWHGLLLPPEMDGVAYVNTPPIFPGKSHIFKFKIRQHGTYWYHSHTNVQEQKGVYGAIIIHPRTPVHKVDFDRTIVLSDWSDEPADEILANLRKEGHYYTHKKNSVRSIVGALQAGGLTTMLSNEWDRMGGMDLSDVGYDAFLANGKQEVDLGDLQPGKKLRLRVINAAASSYFYLSMGDLDMKVIAADGIDIKPTNVREILMGMAETYDLLIELPESKRYELRATAQDVTGHASVWIGSGESVLAKDKIAPDLYAPMSHGSHNHQHLDESSQAGPVKLFTVDDIAALEDTEIKSYKKRHAVKLVLDGDMERYVWHINGKAIHEDRNLVINTGDLIEFTLVNKTMMHHPMHLHGHFFRVLNKFKQLSPLKHTVDVGPHMSRTIEFMADEPGEWMLHCHNLYHMKTGMARVVKYADFQPLPEVRKWQDKDHHLHDHIYYRMGVELKPVSEARLELLRTWDEIELSVTASHETASFSSAGISYRRWLGNFLNVGGGLNWYPDSYAFALTAHYLLPLLIEAEFEYEISREASFKLEKKFQWLSFLESDLGITLDSTGSWDYEADLMYSTSYHWAVGLVLHEGRPYAALSVNL